MGTIGRGLEGADPKKEKDMRNSGINEEKKEALLYSSSIEQLI